MTILANENTPKLQAAIDVLDGIAAKTDSIAVAFSGGKDSLVVMDMALRIFRRVEPFFMWFIPGAECVEKPLYDSLSRFGLSKVRMYPHWALIDALKVGAYCPHSNYWKALPDWTLRNVYDAVRFDTGCEYILTGAKKADSGWRRRFFHVTRSWHDIANPISSWSKLDVLAYIKLRGLKLPDTEGGNSSGLDLAHQAVYWVHDKYPEDWKRLTNLFPYAEAIIKQREFYGVWNKT